MGNKGVKYTCILRKSGHNLSGMSKFLNMLHVALGEKNHQKVIKTAEKENMTEKKRKRNNL